VTLQLQGVAGVDAATLTVSSTNDSGAGSLRQAIADAAPGDTIGFSLTGAITLTNGELLVTNSINISGPGAANLEISGNNASRVFETASNATVGISGVAISSGLVMGVKGVDTGSGAGGPGGPAAGGGIFNAGALSLADCVIRSNTAFGGAGGKGVNAGGDGGDANGGGIWNGGSLSVKNCTIEGNLALGGDGASGTTTGGGGGWAGGGAISGGSTTLTNCTMSSNSIRSGRGGAAFGGLSAHGGSGGNAYGGAVAGASSLVCCTISSNNVVASGGGSAGQGIPGQPGFAFGGGLSSASTSLLNTLIAANAVSAFDIGYQSGPDVSGTVNSVGYNLIGQTNSSTGWVAQDLTGSSTTPLLPGLGPLTNNGGATPTMALLPGSPAIDAGDDAALDPPINLKLDQRGLPRFSGAHVDIGAFERQALLLTGAVPVGTNVLVSFVAEIGASYRVERNDNLASSNWNTVADNLPGAGAIVQVIDSSAATQHQRFYRARIVP
jgi:hypothetical protein